MNREKGKEFAEEGLRCVVEGLRVLGLGLIRFGKVLGQGLLAFVEWLNKVNKGHWGPVLVQWALLFLLGYLAGFLYGMIVR